MHPGIVGLMYIIPLMDGAPALFSKSKEVYFL